MDNNNLFFIGEMAKVIGITRKIILNYETKGLITPDKKDGTTGNRYYITNLKLYNNEIAHFVHDFIQTSLDEIKDLRLR